jgi:hypothetical protein
MIAKSSPPLGAYSPKPNNSPITISPGTYWFADNGNVAAVTANASNIKTTVTGLTTFYVNGSVKIDGSQMGGSSSAQLVIYVCNGGTVTITGNPILKMQIYAPLSAVTITGSPDFRGAVVGQTLSISGSSSFLYDESLGFTPSNATDSRVILVK